MNDDIVVVQCHSVQSGLYLLQGSGQLLNTIKELSQAMDWFPRLLIRRQLS